MFEFGDMPEFEVNLRGVQMNGDKAKSNKAKTKTAKGKALRTRLGSQNFIRR